MQASKYDKTAKNTLKNKNTSINEEVNERGYRDHND
jgi:hypothetical protein